jgi:apolipoprotein N-acyltransferase
MEMDEHWKHNARRHVIKTCGHLLDAQKDVRLALEHAKLNGNFDQNCKAIEDNLNAIAIGIFETIKYCGVAADEIKQTMLTPDATPSPIKGSMGFNLTPFQRSLEREGVKFTTTTQYVPTKQDRRTPKILTFTLKRPPPQRNRKRNKSEGNISI